MKKIFFRILVFSLLITMIGSVVFSTPSIAFNLGGKQFDKEYPDPVKINEITDFEMPEHKAVEIKYDDGNDNHGSNIEDLTVRGILQYKGKDIFLTMKNGKRLNVTHTIMTIQKNTKEQMERTDISSEVKKELKTRWKYDISNDALKNGKRINLRVFSFIEDTKTGEVTPLIHKVTNTRIFGANQGNIIHSLYKFNYYHQKDKEKNHFVSFGPYYRRIEKNDNGEWVYPKKGKNYYIPLENMRLNGELIPQYKNPDDYYKVDANGKIIPELIKIWDRKRDTEIGDCMVSFDYKIPAGAISVSANGTHKSVAEGSHEGNITSTASGVILFPTAINPLSKIKIHYVLDQEYRKIMKYDIDDELKYRLEKKYNKKSDYSNKEKVDIFLEIDGFKKSDELRKADILPKDLLFVSETYNVPLFKQENNNDNLGVRVLDWTWPNFTLRKSENVFNDDLNKNIPKGFIKVDMDLSKRETKPDQFGVHVNPEKPQLLLTKHFYITLRTIPSAVEIVKIDSTNENLKLNGAKFELWNKEHTKKISNDIYITDTNGVVNLHRDFDVSKLDTDDTVKSLAFPDENGVIKLKNGGVLLAPKEYSLKEVGVPNGYELSNQWTDFKVDLKKSNKNRSVPIVVTVKNKKEKEYIVNHKFISATKGVELPQLVKDLLPNDKVSLKDGDKVEPTMPIQEELKVKNGKWVFKGYDNKSIIIDKSDATFIGKWEYVEDNKVTTKWVDEKGKAIKEPVTDKTTKEAGTIEGYTFVKTTTDENGNVTHIFKKVVVEKEYTTKWVDENGKLLKEPVIDKTTKEVGTIEGYTFVKTTTDDKGNVTHIFKKVVVVVEKEYTTKWVDEKGKAIKEPVTDKTTKEAGTIEGYTFVKTTTDENGNVTHIFKKVVVIEKEYTTNWVDENGKAIKEPVTDKTTKEAGTIEGYTFVKTITDENGNVTHIFKKVVVVVEKEYTTKWVDEKGKAVKEPVTAKSIQPRGEIKGYEFVGKNTDKNGNVTYIFKKAKEDKKELPKTGSSSNTIVYGMLMILLGFSLVRKRA